MSQEKKSLPSKGSILKYNINESVRAQSAMASSIVSYSPCLTGDQALQAVGGNSKTELTVDKFQIIAGVVAIFTYASAGWICYGLPYLYNDDPKYVKVLCYDEGDPYPCGLK